MSPGLAKDLIRRGLDLHRGGDAEGAAVLYRAALAEAPEQADAWHLLGLLARDAGALTEAAELVGRAVELEPDFAEYRVNLAAVLLDLRREGEAVAALREAVRLEPELPEAHYNLGNAFLASGDETAALDAFRHAVALRPDYTDALNNIGHVFLGRGEAEIAMEYFRRAVAQAPGFAPVLVNLCAALVDLEQHDEAMEVGRRAVVAAPDDPSAHYNLGNAAAGAQDPETAAGCFRAALSLDPDHPAATCNLGVALLELDQPEAALDALDRALALEPDSPDAHWNRALALLRMERFAEGWAEYEWRWQAVPFLDRRVFEQPEWEGEPLGGRTVLIHTEQGFGDTLLFVRFLPEIAGRGGSVVLACQPPLKRLLADLPGVETVTAYGEPAAAFDLHLPIMSLPRVLGLDRLPVPTIPYLPVPEHEFVKGPAGDGFKVGFVWRSKGAVRSAALADYAPLLECSGVRFFSLQVDRSEAEAVDLAGWGVEDLAPYLTDFADTAAAVARLDLVISVDTVMAHVAGGLGVPVWTFLPHPGDWRWFRRRDDSPWYPTMRLYRQTCRGDWSGPVLRAAADLAAQIAGDRGEK